MCIRKVSAAFLMRAEAVAHHKFLAVKNCQKILLSENRRPKMQKLGLNTFIFGETYGYNWNFEHS